MGDRCKILQMSCATGELSVPNIHDVHDRALDELASTLTGETLRVSSTKATQTPRVSLLEGHPITAWVGHPTPPQTSSDTMSRQLGSV